MQQIVTRGIILSRTNFGEADRIVTIITPDHGKQRLMAKGVRKLKSKLAAGLELFSVSDITYIPGRGEIHTLISSRLHVHYAKIVQNLDRTMLGYELLKQVNRATEDATDVEYFELLSNALAALNSDMDLSLLELWFDAQLLRLAGHQPNLSTDSSGKKLEPNQSYNFDFESMGFTPAAAGDCQAGHIKLLRLVFDPQNSDPKRLTQLQDIAKVLPVCLRLATSMRQQYIRL